MPVAKKKPNATKKHLVGPFRGTVVDAAGKPVAGATVWLIGGVQDDPQIVAKTTSDKKGQFHIAKQPWTMPASPPGHALPTMLAARDSSGRIGGSMYYGNQRLPNDVSPKEFRIKLQNVKDCHGRLTDRSGQPIAGAKIRPTMWSCDWDAEERVQHLIFLPSRLAKEMATETGADGRFTLRSLPTIGHLSANVSTEGFGKPMAIWSLDRPATFQLGRVGGIRGSLACPPDPKAVAKIKLTLQTDFPPRRIRSDESLLRYTADGITGTDGSFRFADVPPGKYNVLPSLPDASPYYSDDTEPIEVKPGETALASISLKRAAKLQGKIVDAATGAGVPGVQVMLYFNEPRRRSDTTKSATTAANGMFTLYSRPGTAFLQLWPIPDQYINPSGGRQTIEVKADATLPPIRLERAKGLEGVVVDKSGKPVAGAKIVCTSLSMNDYFSPDRDLRTDRNGKFLLKRVTPKTRLNIRRGATAPRPSR